MPADATQAAAGAGAATVLADATREPGEKLQEQHTATATSKKVRKYHVVTTTEQGMYTHWQARVHYF